MSILHRTPKTVNGACCWFTSAAASLRFPYPPRPEAQCIASIGRPVFGRRLWQTCPAREFCPEATQQRWWSWLATSCYTLFCTSLVVVAVVIRIGGLAFVVQEKGCALRGADSLERTRRPVEIVEAGQVVHRAAVGKSQGAFANAEVMFQKPQNAPEIVPLIVDVACRRIGG